VAAVGRGMPLQQGYTTVDGERKGWYRWGDAGKRYFYEPGNDRSRATAKGLARRQGQAIESRNRGE